MLKGETARGMAAQAKATAPVRSALVAARAPVSRRQVFKSAKRVVVLAAAAEEAAPAQKAQKLPLASLKTGDVFEGTVTKVDTFGAFVNFGAERDGLVHVSQLSDKYVKTATSVVNKGDTVRVRVLSVDAGANRIALTMKGLSRSAEEAADDDDVEDVEDVEEDEGVEEDDEEYIEPRDGHEFVDAEEEPEMLFEMQEEDPEMTLESVAAFEAMDPDSIQRVVQNDAMPVPVGELITGKVTRLEDYGAFVEFEYEGKKLSALLQSEEAKVPSAALSPEQLAEYVEEGEPVPEYVEIDDEFSLSTYYKPGDEVSAFVLEYTGDNKINLTQFADWELEEAAGYEIDEDEEGDDLAVAEEADVMAYDPLDLVDDDEEDGSAVQEEVEAAFVDLEDGTMTAGDLRAEVSNLSGVSRPLVNQDLNMTFPSRPLNRVSAKALNQPTFRDTDFDGDEIELDDLWQETFRVPKKVHRALGLRFKVGETGEVELVEKENARTRDLSVNAAFTGDHNARVAAFVKDLLAADEDEAELPARAARRPVVLATAVQNISAAVVKDLRNKTGAGMMDCKKALAENDGDLEKATEWLRKKGLAGADKKSGRTAAEGVIARYIHPGSRLGVLLEVNCETDFVAASDKFQSLVGELGMIIAATPEVICVSPEDVPAEVLAKEREVMMGMEDLKTKPEAVRSKIVEGRLAKARDTMALLNQDSLRDPTKKVSEVIKESIAALGENVKVRRFVRYNLGEGLEKKSNDFAAEVAQQTQAKAAAAAPAAAPPAPKKEEPKKAEEKKPAVQVSASVVKELRDKTGAGMMDCKKALAENNNDIEASIEWLRKKGLAGADKKAGRLAAEGVIAAYIHPGSRLGVLLEVNCETDFVAASDKFNALVNSIAMQIAASPSVQYVSADDIPAEVFAREKEIEMGREDLKNKPDAIRAKIAEGRVQKLAQDMALLPQPYLMDPSKTVEQAVKEAIAAIGEKISIRRFIKYQLGEGIEKKESNLAADVAAMAQKSA